MIDLNLDGETESQCEHCEAESAGLIVVAFTVAQQELLFNVLEQIKDAADRSPKVRMSALDRDDLTDLMEKLRPTSRHTGRSR